MPAADVLIAGAGPAGAAVALLLARLGVRVTLVTDASHASKQVGEHLSPLGCLALARLSGPASLAAGHLRCSGIDAAWGSNELQHTDYVMQPTGSGLFLDRASFDARLVALAAAEPGVTMVAGRVAPQIERTRGRWRVGVRAGAATEVVQAAFLIDATGRRSLVARRLGGRRRRADRQVAVVAWLDERAADDGDAERCSRLLLEATTNGWWYTAQLPRALRVVAYLTDADLVDGDPTNLWRRGLRDTQYIQPILPPKARPTRLVTRAADSSILTTTSGDGWAAVGEAAVAFDPVSGFGLRHVLEDAVTAAEGVAAALDGTGDPLASRNDALRRLFARFLRGRREVYQRERRWPHSVFWTRRHAPVNGRLLAPPAHTAAL